LAAPAKHAPTARISSTVVAVPFGMGRLVAGFTFPFVNTFHDPNPDFPFASYPEPFLWFLGMDPQPKSRDFRFDNADSVAHNVTTDLICLNYRTT